MEHFPGDDPEWVPWPTKFNAVKDQYPGQGELAYKTDFVPDAYIRRLIQLLQQSLHTNLTVHPTKAAPGADLLAAAPHHKTFLDDISGFFEHAKDTIENGIKEAIIDIAEDINEATSAFPPECPTLTQSRS